MNNDRKSRRCPDTVPEFDEAIYLKLNPDVAMAVRSGKFSDGLTHYVSHGRIENRPYLMPPVPKRNAFTFDKVEDTRTLAPREGPPLTIESVFASRRGFFVNGWCADGDDRIDTLDFVGNGWSLRIGSELLARVRRSDVEAALSRGSAYAYGFWTFVYSAHDIVPGECRAVFTYAGGTSKECKVTLSIKSEEELRDTTLTYLASQEGLGNAQAAAIAALDGGLGRQIVTYNHRISRQIVSAAHVERFHVRTRPPKASVIVCLYGKPEFLFLQAALFHTCPGMEDYEFVYVSNSPSIIEPLMNEARIVSQTYNVDLTCVLLPSNAGFGAANNIAVEKARSRRIIILNPDVFPKDERWAERHTDIVENGRTQESKLFGAPLYYDDGSLMHGGMYFDLDRALILGATGIEMRNLVRVEHFGKGTPPHDPAYSRARPVPAVTGAFVSAQRSWYEKLGGFTEDYIFGHYEDADICLKSWEAGTQAWLHDLKLWHLEGKGSTRLQVHEGGSIVNRWLFSDLWQAKVAQSFQLGTAAVAEDLLMQKGMASRPAAAKAPVILQPTRALVTRPEPAPPMPMPMPVVQPARTDPPSPMTSTNGMVLQDVEGGAAP